MDNIAKKLADKITKLQNNRKINIKKGVTIKRVVTKVIEVKL